MTERIRTTHIGSLPRPDDLVLLLRQNDEGVVIDGAGFGARALGGGGPGPPAAFEKAYQDSQTASAEPAVLT